MTSNELTNKQIKQFFETYIKGKKDVYFLISTGTFYAQKTDPYHPKTEEYSGEKKFLKTLEEVFEENPYQIGVSLFEKATKNIKNEPYHYKTFILHKEKPEEKNPNNTLNGIGLEGFGGLEGILDSKVSVKYLSGENERLKKENDKLEVLNEKLNEALKSAEINLKQNNSEGSEKISDLKEQIKNKEWEIKALLEDHKRIVARLEDDHKRDLAGIEDKNNKFEKVMTIGGLVAAKVAGIHESDLKGILGIDTEKDTDAVEQTAGNADDIEFSEIKQYKGKKSEAKEFIDSVLGILIHILDSNSEEDAYKLIASFYNIIGYANSSIENLTKLNNIAVSAYNTDQKRSAADDIIEQANNYSENH